MLEKVTGDAKDENRKPKGLPQLCKFGRFEMLQCLTNCRDQTVVESSWSVRDLKSTLGGPAKIYLRPIQKSLSTRSLEPKKAGSQLETILFY